jgi:hypothetical protein
MNTKQKAEDVRCKFDKEMFSFLVSGKEVIIQQPDGSHWHFILEDIGFDEMEKAIRDARSERESVRGN